MRDHQQEMEAGCCCGRDGAWRLRLQYRRYTRLWISAAALYGWRLNTSGLMYAMLPVSPAAIGGGEGRGGLMQSLESRSLAHAPSSSTSSETLAVPLREQGSKGWQLRCLKQ